MAEQLKTKIRRVRKKINEQLAAERVGMGHYGIGLQREGWVGGYLQALDDVSAAMNGFENNNSRFAGFWEKPAKAQGARHGE